MSASRVPGNPPSKSSRRAFSLRTCAVAAQIGWHYLSDATCLIRPHSFCMFFVVSMITIMCFMIRNC